MFHETIISRRRLAALIGAAAALSCLSAGIQAEPADSPLEALEHASGAEIGASLIDELGGPVLAWRADEAFASNETAAGILALRIIEKHWRAAQAKIGAGGAPEHAPVYGGAPADQQVTFLDAAKAACGQGDHRAYNMLLKSLSGPEGMTAWLQYKGDLKTRIDRYAPDNERTSTYDVRDKTRPSAAAQLWQRMYIDFTPDERADFEDILRAGEKRAEALTSRLPKGWSAAGIFGDGLSDDECNRSVHAVLWNPDGSAFFLALHARTDAKLGPDACAKAFEEALGIAAAAASAAR